MTTRVLRVFVAGISYAAVLGALGACTSLLGTFDTAKGEVSASSGAGASQAGGGGAGGSIGSGGSGGGVAGLPFDCHWTNKSHQAFGVAGDTSVQREEIRVVPRPGGARPRLLTSELNQSTSSRKLGIYSTESGSGIFVDGMYRLLDVQRLGDSSVGVLATYYDQQLQRLGLMMLVVPDAPEQPAVASVVAVKLVEGNGWPADSVPDKSGRFSGRFVVTTPASSGNTIWGVNYVASYKSTTGQYIATFGQSVAGSPPKRLFMMTPAGYGTSENDNELAGLLHVPKESAPTGKDTDYVFLGQTIQGGKAGEFTVTATTTGQVTPREFTDGVLVGAVVRPDGFNAAFASFDSNNVTLRTHKLPFTALGKFTNSDVPVTVSFEGFGYLPVGQASVGWLGDLFALVGGTAQAPGSPLGYAFFDADSKERGHGALPFTAPLPAGVTRTGLNSVAVADGFSVQPNLIRTFEVAWLDGQKKDASAPTSILYYDRLECLATGN